MFDTLIRASLVHRWLVLGLAALLLFFGARSALVMPVDVLPELAAPTVTIVTEAEGLAPEEVERLVTLPLEQAVSGARDVRRMRSSSGIGISLIWVDFEWDTDPFAARQVIAERVASAHAALPDRIEPILAPASSIMGEVMFVGVTADAETSARELRDIAEFSVRRRLFGDPRRGAGRSHWRGARPGGRRAAPGPSIVFRPRGARRRRAPGRSVREHLGRLREHRRAGVSGPRGGQARLPGRARRRGDRSSRRRRDPPARRVAPQAGRSPSPWRSDRRRQTRRGAQDSEATAREHARADARSRREPRPDRALIAGAREPLPQRVSSSRLHPGLDPQRARIARGGGVARRDRAGAVPHELARHADFADRAAALAAGGFHRTPRLRRLGEHDGARRLRHRHRRARG